MLGVVLHVYPSSNALGHGSPCKAWHPCRSPWGGATFLLASPQNHRSISVRRFVMANRREFIQGVLGSTASVAVSSVVASRRVLGAIDRIRIGLIGAGARGKYVFKEAIKCSNVERVAVADVYT